MAEADPITTLYPLTDFVDPLDVLLVDYLPQPSFLDQILVADARSELGDDYFLLDATFHIGSLPALHLPGLDLVQLEILKGGFAGGTLICSESPSLRIDEIKVALTFDPSILGDGQERGSIEADCGFVVDINGFRLTSCTGATLKKCRVAGTDAMLEISGIRLADAPDDDDWLVATSAKLELEMFKGSDNRPLTLEGADLAIGRHGPSGRFDVDLDAPLACTIGGFSCEIDQAGLVIDHGSLRDLGISGRIDISAFAADGSDGIVDVDFAFGSHGVSATIHDPDVLIELKASGVFSMTVTTLRLDDNVLWLSGDLTPEIEGVDGDWPTLAFEEIGITPSGDIRLGAGASIATDQPFSVNWGIAALTITSFTLERPDDAPDDIELRLSASIELVKGLPAGASVDGLVARWHKDQRTPSIRFDGIGLHYGTPGAFNAAVAVSYDGESKSFSGSGHADIPAIDTRLEVVFAVRGGDGYNCQFLAAETSLPGGVPIGATGLSLYGVSGLIAHNMEIVAPGDSPRRYFEAFIADPKPGFAVLEKWQPAEGHQALGLGVVLGTGDDGWSCSIRGGLILTIPDLSILVTASADLLNQRPGMTNPGQGKLSAVLAVLPPLQQMRLDFAFDWDADPLFQVRGDGGGEFYFNRPLDGRVWAGKSPETGSPIMANVFRLTDDWLFSAGYWLSIGLASGVEVGVIASIGMRTGLAGLYAGIEGRARGGLKLSYAPFQIEGTLTLSAQGYLRGGGIGIDLGVYAGFTLAMPRPQKLEVPLEACISIDIGIASIKFCLGYTFLWEVIEPPLIEPLIQGISFLPRDWSPRSTAEFADDVRNWPTPDQAGPPKAGNGAATSVETGIATSALDAAEGSIIVGDVHPHSVIALEFAKSVTVAVDPKHLSVNDLTVPYPRTIGSKSGFSERWMLDALRLHDVDDDVDIAVFGVFTQSPAAREADGKAVSPRPVNTELRLFTSNRFGQSGSLGGGGAEETPRPDCGPRDIHEDRCVDFSHTTPGFGRLKNGWCYSWRSLDRQAKGRVDGLLMRGDDSFDIEVPEGLSEIELHWVDLNDGNLPPEPWQPINDVMPVPASRRLMLPRNRFYQKLCWQVLITNDGRQGASEQHGSSGREEWTVKAAERTLTPGHRYTLDLSMSGQILDSYGNIVRRRRIQRDYSFTARRTPDWANALSRAICGVYPDDGRRPVFRHYDLVARFGEDIYAEMYRRDHRELGFRLIDSDGAPVEFAPGLTVMVPPAWRKAPPDMPPVEKWWREARARDPGSNCTALPPPPNETDTILPVRMDTIALRPHSRYKAEIVAVDAHDALVTVTPPLMRWSFTTSAFETFSGMASPPEPVPAFGVAQLAAPRDTSFDAIAEAFGIPAIANVQTMRMTPLVTGNSVAHVLIEAPEPLRDREDRLEIEIAGAVATIATNRDATRVIATPVTPVAVVASTDTLSVVLRWNGAPTGAPTEARRSINDVSAIETCKWNVPLRKVV